MRILSSFGRRCGFHGSRLTPLHRQLFAALNVAKHPDVLADAILIDFHFLRSQVRDCVMVLVAHHQIEKHFPRAAVNDRAVRFNRGRLAGLRAQSRQENEEIQSNQSNYGKNPCRHADPLTSPALRCHGAGFPTIRPRPRPPVYPRWAEYARFPWKIVFSLDSARSLAVTFDVLSNSM